MQRLRIIACSIIALFCLCQSARAQGSVLAWGYNNDGELGNGTYTTTSPYGIGTPGTVSGLTGVTAMAELHLRHHPPCHFPMARPIQESRDLPSRSC